MKKLISIILAIAIIASGCYFANPFIDNPYSYNEESDYIDTSKGKYPVDFDFESIYADEDAWNSDYERLMEVLPEFKKYQGTLNTAQGIYDYFQEEMHGEANQLIEKLASYADFGNMVYPTDPTFRKLSSKISDAYDEFDKQIAFVDQEIVSIPYEDRIKIFDDPLLVPYQNVFGYLLYEDSEALTEEELQEEINRSLSLGRMKGLYDIVAYSLIPDIEFWVSDDEYYYLDGTTIEEFLAGDFDRETKIEAFEAWWANVGDYADTLTYVLETYMLENYSYALQSDYSSVKEAALDNEALPSDIIDRIIEAAHKYSSKAVEVSEKYGLSDGRSEFYLFDASNYLSDFRPDYISYDDTVDKVGDALSILGPEYVDMYYKMIETGYIDVYPKENKTESGFQLSGYLNVDPMIMYNYIGDLDSSLTVAHEMGHAVYSMYSADNQDYCFACPETITQEIASTLNEIIYFNYLQDNAKDDEERLYYLEYEINELIVLLYREIIYQELEDYCYDVVESGMPLDSEDICEYFDDLYKLYYGDHFTFGDYGVYRWLTIPHLYYDHYVFQYTVDACYALYIFDKLSNGDPEILDNYIKMLKMGNSVCPEDLLNVIGIDINSSEPFDAAFEYFYGLVDEFEALAAKLGK